MNKSRKLLLGIHILHKFICQTTDALSICQKLPSLIRQRNGVIYSVKQATIKLCFKLLYLKRNR